MAKKSKLSFFERINLFFGFVGLLADFAALVTFSTGLVNFDQFINKITPATVSQTSTITFFRVVTSLIIIYGWLAISWYLIRRTFVLREERPKSFKRPLSSRTTRVVTGVGIFLVPIALAWSVVNINVTGEDVGIVAVVTPTSTINSSASPYITETQVVTETLSPALATLSTSTSTEIAITPAKAASSTSISPTPVSTNIGQSTQQSDPGVGLFWMIYLAFFLPLIMFVLGLIVWWTINLLMPIIHLEMLDDFD